MVIPKTNAHLSQDEYFEKLVTLVTDFSQLLIANGEEVRIVEVNARKMSIHYGARSISFNATPMEISLLIVAPDGNRFSSKYRIKRNNNFGKLTDTYDLLKRMIREDMDFDEVLKELEDLKRRPKNYPDWLVYVGVGLGCGGLAITAGGTVADFLPAALAGGLSILATDLANKVINFNFLAEIIGGIVIGLVGAGMMKLGFGESLYWIVFGGIMGNAPGVALTSAFREFYTDNHVSGVSMMVTGLLDGLSIAIGVYMAMEMLGIHLFL